jgi:hypothetical protein
MTCCFEISKQNASSPFTQYVPYIKGSSQLEGMVTMFIADSRKPKTAIGLAFGRICRRQGDCEDLHLLVGEGDVL